MEKITKKQIKETLLSKNTTAIFALAKKCGININKRGDLMSWIKDNAPSQKIVDAAYSLSYGASFKNESKRVYDHLDLPITNAINFAKFQKKEGYMATNYGKILIEGITHIYWAHPSYQHEDYNKHRAFPNTEKYRKISGLINSFLYKK